MPALYAEIQVAGLAEPVATFDVCLDRSIDDRGMPSSTVRYPPIRATLVGLAAMVDFFTKWGADDHMRRSGWLVVYDGDQVRWRLAFYDAWCVVYRVNFQPGVDGQTAFVVELALSAALWDWEGMEIEHHSDLWWEKDYQVRKRALTPPPPLLPAPSARNLPAERQPTPPQDPPPTAALQAQPSKKRKKKPKSPYSGSRPTAPTQPVLSDSGIVNEYGKWYYERPFGYRSGVRDKAFEGAKEQDGGVYDPLTRTPIASTDKWDMGHKPGYEFRKHQLNAAQRAIGRKQFVDEHNVPGHYRPELPSSNRSHQEEDMTDLFLGGI